MLPTFLSSEDLRWILQVISNLGRTLLHWLHLQLRQQVNVLPGLSFWGISHPSRAGRPQNRCPPWPAPSDILKLHPQKQVRCQNATVTPRLRSQRTVGVFENEMSLWVTSGVLNVLIKTFSIYLIFCVTEERKAFLLLLFWFYLLPTPLGYCNDLISPSAWLQSELLAWTWHRNATDGKSHSFQALFAKCCFPTFILVTITPLVLY